MDTSGAARATSAADAGGAAESASRSDGYMGGHNDTDANMNSVVMPMPLQVAHISGHPC